MTAAEVDAKIATHDENREAHPHGLSAPLMIWESAEIYKVNDVRVHEKKIWMCIEANSDTDFDKDKWVNIGGGGGGHAIGDIVWRSIYNPHVVGEVLANGAEVSRAMYPQYNALCAEHGYPWGAGDGSTTVNLPNLIGKFPEGANVAGGYHEAGLPNITGGIGTLRCTDGATRATGAFSSSIESTIGGSNYNVSAIDAFFDASDSNPVYGKSTTVQPPSALLLPYVVVFTEATADSALVDMTQIAQDLANKANRSLTNVEANVDFVVDSYSDEVGNWYRKYKSGWVEQGGYIDSGIKDIQAVTINLLKPMTDNNYSILITRKYEATEAVELGGTPTVLSKNIKTTTSFKVTSYINGLYWQTCGQGANV